MYYREIPMKINHFKSLIVAGFIGLTPVKASVMQLMGGGGEQEDENAMNFPQFFDTIGSDFEFSKKISYHPRQSDEHNTNRITFSVTIVTTDALARRRDESESQNSKKRKKHHSDDLAFQWYANEDFSWLTPESLKQNNSSLPSLVVNQTVSDIHDTFIEQLIIEKVGTELMPSHEEKVDLNFFNTTLKQSNRPSDFFEHIRGTQLKKRKRSESDFNDSEVENDSKTQRVSDHEDSDISAGVSKLKRPQFTRKTVLDQIYKTERHQDLARRKLCENLFYEEYKCARLFYYEKGFVILRLTTENDVISDGAIAVSQFFNRIPNDKEEIIDTFEDWMKAQCNLLYKNMVLDKNKGHLYT